MHASQVLSIQMRRVTSPEPPAPLKRYSAVFIRMYVMVAVTCCKAHAICWSVTVRRHAVTCRAAVVSDTQSVVVTGVRDLETVVQRVGPVAGVKRLHVDVQLYRTASGETRQFGETEPVVASEVTKASLVVRPVSVYKKS